MTDLTKGITEMVDDLEKASKVAGDKKIEIKALTAGAKPIVDRAKVIASRFRRTGHLVESIGAEYSDKSHTMRIGIGEPISTTNSATGFYGRFNDQGWRPVNFKRSGRRGRAKGKRTQTGQTVQNPFIEPAYQAEETNAFDKIQQAYEGALK